MATGTADSAGQQPPFAAPPSGPPPGRPGGWTPGRIVAVVAGAVLSLVSVCLLGGGGALLWADQALRHDGYLATDSTAYSTGGCALASERIAIGSEWLLTGLIGDVRIRVTAADPATPVFVAIGPADRVAAYLSGTRYTTVTGAGPDDLVTHTGTAVPAPPRTAGIWTAQVAGPGTQTLQWTAADGDWMAVAMNPDGSPGLTVWADAGVSAPWLFRLALEFITGGIVLGALSGALVVVPVRLAAGAG